MDEETNKAVLRPNECFKRPFFEPFVYDEDGAGALLEDDCEGQAIWIQGLFVSYRHLYEAHMHEGTRETRAAYAIKMEVLNEYFPDHLFTMTEEEKRMVFDVAMLIGEDACKGFIRCHTTVVTAQAGAMGSAGEKGVYGHVCCTFQSWHAVLKSGLRMEDAFARGIHPVDMIGEGTNCIQNEAHATEIEIQGPDGVVMVPMADIANHIASEILGDKTKDKRMAVHLTQAKNTAVDFYMTAFIQGSELLATQATDDSKQLRYGVDCINLSDYKDRVSMPVTGKVLEKAMHEGASQWLKDHCEARAREIHTPRTGHETVLKALKHWAPSGFYGGDPALKGRKYSNCVVSEAFRERRAREQAYAAKKTEAVEYNRTSKIGHMRTWMGMDSVFVSVSMWTDTTECLRKMVCDVICHAAKIDEMSPEQKKGVAEASDKATARHRARVGVVSRAG